MHVDEAFDNALRARKLANAFITLADRDDVAKAARTDGPLAGTLLSVKDDLFTAGLRTTGGSRVFNDFVPDRDCPSVAALKRLGAAIIGKTNLTEFAMSLEAGSPLAGPCRHPLSPDHWAGASSGGAAAAAWFAAGDAAIATDSGGSARAPAAICGVACYNPTPDPALRGGSFGANRTLMSLGILSRDICIAGRIGAFLRAKGQPASPSKPRLGYIWLDQSKGMNGHDPKVSEAVESTARHVMSLLGHVELDPLLLRIDGTEAFPVISDIERLEEMTKAGTLSGIRPNHFGAGARSRLETARRRTKQEHSNANVKRLMFRAQIDQILEKADVILSPTVCYLSPKLNELDDAIDPQNHAGNLTWVNLAELPAISLPVARLHGFPIGLQIVAQRHDDAVLLDLARQVQAEVSFGR